MYYVYMNIYDICFVCIMCSNGLSFNIFSDICYLWATSTYDTGFGPVAFLDIFSTQHMFWRTFVYLLNGSIFYIPFKLISFYLEFWCGLADNEAFIYLFHGDGKFFNSYRIFLEFYDGAKSASCYAQVNILDMNNSLLTRAVRCYATPKLNLKIHCNHKELRGEFNPIDNAEDLYMVDY